MTDWYSQDYKSRNDYLNDLINDARRVLSEEKPDEKCKRLSKIYRWKWIRGSAKLQQQETEEMHALAAYLDLLGTEIFEQEEFQQKNSNLVLKPAAKLYQYLARWVLLDRAQMDAYLRAALCYLLIHEEPNSIRAAKKALQLLSEIKSSSLEDPIQLEMEMLVAAFLAKQWGDAHKCAEHLKKYLSNLSSNRGQEELNQDINIGQQTVDVLLSYITDFEKSVNRTKFEKYGDNSRLRQPSANTINNPKCYKRFSFLLHYRVEFSRIGLTDWVVLCTDMLLAIPTIWDLTGTGALKQNAWEKHEKKRVSLGTIPGAIPA